MKFRFHYIYFVGVADKGIDLHICWRFFWVMPYIYYVYLRVPCHLLCEELSSNGGAWDVQAWSPFLSYTMLSLNEQNSLKLNFVSRNIALVISSALCILKSTGYLPIFISFTLVLFSNIWDTLSFGCRDLNACLSLLIIQTCNTINLFKGEKLLIWLIYHQTIWNVDLPVWGQSKITYTCHHVTRIYCENAVTQTWQIFYIKDYVYLGV